MQLSRDQASVLLLNIVNRDVSIFKKVLANAEDEVMIVPKRREQTHPTHHPRPETEGAGRDWALCDAAVVRGGTHGRARHMPQTVLPPFNNGLPLTVVRIPSDWEGEDDEFGVVDESTLRVWKERSLSSTVQPDLRSLPVVRIPDFPGNYGEWQHKSIGGVSKTVRRVNIIRAGTKVKGPVTLFCLRCSEGGAVLDALRDVECVVGTPQYVDEEHGIVTEVIVNDAEDLAHVCALVHKTGSAVMLEDSSVNAQRCLGIERLDRIGAEVVTDANMYEEDDGVYGLRRGGDNWKFPFLPEGWVVPITWDHMVENVLDEPLMDIPQPLRQHVARRRLREGRHEPIGSRWKPTVPPTQEETARRGAPGLRRIIESPSDEIRGLIRDTRSRSVPMGSSAIEGICLNTIALVDGTWYRPVDTTAVLKRHASDVGGRRYVSAALKTAQSKQLLTAFYYLCIERIADPDVTHACVLVMYHYMKERGYTGRWMGKYHQAGYHIGNGDSFRTFNRLPVYAPHRLPSAVLNKLCGTDGKLRSKGSKGTRSKYMSAKERYVPKRRLKRLRDTEARMVVPTSGP